MSFADPVYDRSDTLPQQLWRTVEDQITLRDVTRGLIIKEYEYMGKILIVFDDRRFRIFKILEEKGEPAIQSALNDYLNPESQAYCEDMWRRFGVHCYATADIPQNILDSIKFLPSRGLKKEQAPLFLGKER